MTTGEYGQLALFNPNTPSEMEQRRPGWNQIHRCFQREDHLEFHLWVCCNPFSESTLCFTPLTLNEDGYQVELEVFDPDGGCINALTMESTALPTPILIDPLLGGSKWEGGMKHAHLVVRSKGLRPHTRMTYGQRSVLTNSSFILSIDRPCSFPIRVRQGTRNFLTVVNFFGELSALRCKFFIGTRAPELLLNVPGNGSRLFGLDHLFAELINMKGEKDNTGYLRFTTKSETGLGISLFEAATSAVSDAATEKVIFIS